MNLEDLKELYRVAHAARSAADAACPKIFKPGAYMSYVHGGHVRWVTIIECSPHYGRVLVEGQNSRQYWLEANRFW